MTDRVKWERGGKRHVLETYEKLHAGKLGAHWIWVALEQIAMGVPEMEVMADYGYVPDPRIKERSA